MVKKLTIVSVVLIVINVALLATIFFRRGSDRGPHRQRDPRENFDQRLAHRLDFSATQRQLYRERTMAHRQRHQELSLALMEVKRNIHQTLGVSDEDRLALLLPKMDSIHSLREREVIMHAKAIMDICEEDQKREFMRLLANSIEGREGFHRRRRGRLSQ